MQEILSEQHNKYASRVLQNIQYSKFTYPYYFEHRVPKF